ncbi:MAG: carotenoid 1,2-hydratase [Burkholderiaceae bacterium]
MPPPGLARRQWLVAAGSALILPRYTLAAPGDRILTPRPLDFPRDHGSHNDTRTEWWYLTGHGVTRDRRELGFQVTFFRSRVDVARDLRSRLAARQLLFAHAAITDLRQGRLLHDQRIARWNGVSPGTGSATEPAFASDQDTHVRLHDWWFRRFDGDRYQTRVDGGDIGIHLEARPRQALLLQGDRGHSRKGPDPAQASFYVSHPQLAVSGQLRLGTETLNIEGSAWLDHEWSEALLHPEAHGWDWIGMNLHNGDSLTAFQLRRADGSALWAGGSWRGDGGQRDPLAGLRFGPDQVHMQAGKRWTSALTQARYPVEWQLDTPAGRFRVQPLLDKQELDSRQSTGTAYWEGLSDLLDAAGRPVGRGYLEMTGYAGRLNL